MRLEIDAGGRRVTAEVPDTGVSPREVLADVLAAWKATDGARPESEGPAYGFSHERRHGQVSPMVYGVGPGRHDYEDPRAEGGDGGS